MANISWWNREIVEIVCVFEKELPIIFIDLQVHLLIHILDEFKLAGVLSCHWMFFLENYMKEMKGFVKQMEKLKGFMVEGYMVYESLY